MDTVALTKFFQAVLALLERVLVVLSRRAGIGVNRQFNIVADKPVTSGRWQLMLQRIADKNRQHFIMPRDAGEIGLCRPGKSDEVADHDDQAARPGHAAKHRHRPG